MRCIRVLTGDRLLFLRMSESKVGPFNPPPHHQRQVSLDRFTTLKHCLQAHSLTLEALVVSRNLSQSSQASPIILRTSPSTPTIMSHSKNVTSINVVTFESSAGPLEIPPQTDSQTLSPGSPSSAGQGHSRSRSNPKSLSAPSPMLAHAGSPTDDAPPAPTFSASSVH